ncbi:MAG: dTDP-4-dehydrorhamnose reductase [bacterium]|nr:dTDP-4-dehydrorhamnose reductase [bacterium]
MLRLYNQASAIRLIIMKFLITGANGQLAREFLGALTDYQVEALNRNQLDVSDMQAVSDVISSYKPDIVLNCSAYNLVDRAEDDIDAALRVNADGVKNLASVSKKYHSLLVHYSTDYVFDGTKNDFYTEDDVPNPINNYGKSKLAGEKVLLEETDNFLLFRTSWVFGQGKQNFLYKLAEWAKTNRVLRIVYDQLSIPTCTEDIVRVTMLAIKNGLKGMYHLTNSGYASRYEVARYILERLGMDNLVLPVSSDYFPVAAKRPFFSALSNGRLSKELGISIPEWRDGIDRFVSKM